MSEKLERCPFCGSDYVGIVYRWTVDHKKQFAVWCYECENHTLWCPKKKMAVAGWDLICERAKVVKPMAMGTIEKSSTVERTAKVIEHDASITDTDGYKYHRSEYLCGNCKKKVLGGDEYCSHCGCRLDWGEDIPMEYFENGGI